MKQSPDSNLKIAYADTDLIESCCGTEPHPLLIVRETASHNIYKTYMRTRNRIVSLAFRRTPGLHQLLPIAQRSTRSNPPTSPPRMYIPESPESLVVAAPVTC